MTTQSNDTANRAVRQQESPQPPAIDPHAAAALASIYRFIIEAPARRAAERAEREAVQRESDTAA